MWISEPERYEVWAALLSCGHFQWLIEIPGATIDEGASWQLEPLPCWQCRGRIDGRIYIPKRAFQAARPAFATFEEKARAYREGRIPRELRWR